MKQLLLLSLLGAFGLAACSPSNVVPNQPATPVTPTANEELNALHEQFHGKYKIVSSVSSEAVDINLDGKASKDLRQEMDELNFHDGEQYHIDVRIYSPTLASPTPFFYFTQWWPEQSIRTGPGKIWDNGDLIAFNPAYLVNYDFQGTGRRFTVSSNRKQFTLTPNADENPFRWVLPESVTVEANGHVRVVNKRRLYTRDGVKEIRITTVYERFTMTT
jgi:hypothetical protein